MHWIKMAWRVPVGVLALAMMMAVNGCGLVPSDDAPPPTVASIDSLQTAQFLTVNAPPAGFGRVTYDPLDGSLVERLGWAYAITGSFKGTFDASGDPAVGEFEIQAEANELGETRRVVLIVEGTALSPHDAQRRLEGVRFSNDYYFVGADGVCESGEALASPIADLTAGDVIGGVQGAVPNGQRDEMGGMEVWQYVIDGGAVRTPAVRLLTGRESQPEIDLWIAPAINAVVRFDVTIEVTGATLLWADASAGTVSGVLELHYRLDLSRVDDQPNISIPNGC